MQSIPGPETLKTLELLKEPCPEPGPSMKMKRSKIHSESHVLSSKQQQVSATDPPTQKTESTPTGPSPATVAFVPPPGESGQADGDPLAARLSVSREAKPEPETKGEDEATSSRGPPKAAGWTPGKIEKPFT